MLHVQSYTLIVCTRLPRSYSIANKSKKKGVNVFANDWMTLVYLFHQIIHVNQKNN